MNLKLKDIFDFSEKESENVRVRFSMFNGIEDPKNIYIDDPEKINTEWFLYSGKRFNNFRKGMIAISLISVGKDIWLLTTVKKITDVHIPENGKVWDCNCYETEIVEKYAPFFGRTYISFHKNRQSGKYKWNTVKDMLLISKITSETYCENTFTSYKFELTFKQLESIIQNGREDWFNALRHIQAVYLITDKSNGKHYVGSATSTDEFLLSRWRTYINNGHGGNVKLMELIEKNGFDYIKNNFTYRILDYFSENYPSAKVIDSETYWKDVFKSREFGYNSN